MDRRSFLRAALSGMAGFALDPERLLWTKTKTIFIPAPAPIQWVDFDEALNHYIPVLVRSLYGPLVEPDRRTIAVLESTHRGLRDYVFGIALEGTDGSRLRRSLCP